MLLRQGSVGHCQVEHPADQLRLGEHPLGLHPAGPDRRPHLLSLHHLWNSGANDGRSTVNYVSLQATDTDVLLEKRTERNR